MYRDFSGRIEERIELKKGPLQGHCVAISYTAPNISPITQRKTFSLLRRLIVRAWAACVMSDRNCLGNLRTCGGGGGGRTYDGLASHPGGSNNGVSAPESNVSSG